MKMNRTSSVVEYRLGARFEQLKKKLTAEEYRDRLERPLAFWALPDDRRLPLAFMGRSVGEILDTPFDELTATPGVGQKKIATLIELLERVLQQPVEEPESAAASTEAADEPKSDEFDPSTLSEAKWAKWRAVVARHGLGFEPLGRFAPSLERLPRVLWHTPLETYVNSTLDEIRQLKTHGEKRVNAVAEVFWHLYRMLANVDEHGPLAVRVVPRFVVTLERWLRQTLAAEELAAPKEIQRYFVEPLIQQVAIDAGDHIARLAERRIGVRGSESSVRQAARNLGITRARVYQLLADIGAIMSVRWLEGQSLVSALVIRLQSEAADHPNYSAALTAAELFFPGMRSHDDAQGESTASQLPLNHRRRAS